VIKLFPSVSQITDVCDRGQPLAPPGRRTCHYRVSGLGPALAATRDRVVGAPSALSTIWVKLKTCLDTTPRVILKLSLRTPDVYFGLRASAAQTVKPPIPFPSDYPWRPEMLPEPSTGAYQLGDFGCGTWCIGRGCLVPDESRPVSEGSRIRYLEILAGYRTPIQTGI
jgi:hypothetical protein